MLSGPSKPTKIRTDRTKGDEPMACAIKKKEYIKQNSLVFGVLLDQYLQWESERGKKSGSINNYRKLIRCFLTRCPPCDPFEVDVNTFSITNENLLADGIDGEYRVCVLSRMGKFVEFYSGTNPHTITNPKSKGRWFEGRLGEFLFEGQMNAFLDYMKSMGRLESTLRVKRMHITTCCQVLNKDLNVTDLNQIDERCYTHLSSIMFSIRSDVCKHIISDFDEFILFSTGKRYLNLWKKNRLSLIIPESEEQLAMESILKNYLDDCLQRGLRKSSVDSFERSIRNCYNRFYEMFGPVHPKDIDYKMMREFRNNTEGLTDRTIRINLSCMGACLEFAYGVNPCHIANIRWTTPQPKRVWIFKKEWKELWEAADSTERVILALAGGMGLRRSEISSVRLSDINKGELIIRGKGSGEGKVIHRQMPNAVKNAIEEYLVERERILLEYGMECDALLVRRDRCKGAPMTNIQLDYVIKSLGEKVGIRVTCHSLRRFYCTSLSDAGVDLDTIRRMMRHEDLSTTLGSYLAADPRKVSNATGIIDTLVFG